MSDTPQSPAQDSLAEHDEARPMRTVKSFVMRAGRMTEGQQRGLDLGWPKFGLELSDEVQDFDAIFGRQAPRTFEIGFGMGHSTLEMAAAAPDIDFIGVEVHKPGVGALLNGLLTQGWATCGYIAATRWKCCATASATPASIALLFFPDPWQHKRHHKRRIVQPEFAELVRRKLKVGGVLHMATMPGALCRAHAGRHGARRRATATRPKTAASCRARKSVR
ncbi:tRNA (guanine(46)-N(7))-methyltransferase TrmB [Pseudomonas aeruginosa]